MDVIFPERTQVIKGLFCQTSLMLLQIAATLAELLDLGLVKLTKHLQKYSRGRFKETDAKRLLKIARSTVGFADPVWKYELELLVPRILELQKQIKDVKKRIEEYVDDHFRLDIQNLIEMPIFSMVSSAAVIGFLGNLQRFTGKRVTNKVTAFAGFAVMQYSSGQKERIEHISKAGPSVLRFHLAWISIRAVKVEGSIRQFYERMVNRGKAKSLVLVAVARKLLCCSFYVLRVGANMTRPNFILEQVWCKVICENCWR